MFISDVAYSVFKGYWFLWAYVALMLFAPILNAATEGDEKAVNVRVLPFLSMVFGWSYLVQVPMVTNFIPKVVGFDPLSVLTLAAIYVCARIIRMRKYDELMSWRKSLAVVLLTAPMCTLGFSHYNSIFSLLLAFALFCLFKNLRVYDWAGQVVIFVAPSMFSVYILHQCCRGFGFVKIGMNFAGIVSGLPIVQTFLAATAVFAAGIAVDLLFRRVPLILWRKR